MPKRKLTEEEEELIRDITRPYYNAAEDMPYGSLLREGFEESVEDFGGKLEELLYDAGACNVSKLIVAIPIVMTEKGNLEQALPSKTQFEIGERIDEPLAKLFRLLGNKAEQCKGEKE